MRIDFLIDPIMISDHGMAKSKRRSGELKGNVGIELVIKVTKVNLRREIASPTPAWPKNVA